MVASYLFGIKEVENQHEFLTIMTFTKMVRFWGCKAAIVAAVVGGLMIVDGVTEYNYPPPPSYPAWLLHFSVFLLRED